MDAFVAAHLAMFYDTLGTSPHQNCGKVSDAQWSDSYVMALYGLKHLFETTKTLAEAEVLNERLAMYLGLEGSAIRGMPLTESYPYFAAGGGGSRRLHAPGVMTLRQSELARWLPKLGWPTSKRAVRASLVPVLFKDKTWRVCRIVGNKYRCDGEKKYQTENEAIDALLTQITTETTKQNIPSRPGGDDLERSGCKDVREGKNVTSDDLLREYGFRGIQYGNAVSQKERQRWTNEIYDALSDLAFALGFPNRWIGFGGQLALAIGARGVGGSSHNAHYEPDLKVTNLTRTKGAGSFAHEWGHALDARLVQTMGKKGLGLYMSQNVYVDPSLTGKKRRIAEAMQSIMEFIKPNYMSGASNYLKSARRIRGLRGGEGYWDKTEELFARAFEAYVQDTLNNEGRFSPWLVHGTLESDYDLNIVAACPYPVGEERVRINSCFAELIEAMKMP